MVKWTRRQSMEESATVFFDGADGALDFLDMGVGIGDMKMDTGKIRAKAVKFVVAIG